MVKNGLTFFQNKNKPIEESPITELALRFVFFILDSVIVTDSSSAGFLKGACV